MRITTNDATELQVDDWGTGRPVVLVHAWGLDSHMWDPQVTTLLAAGLRVVTIDRRGHGRSDRATSGYDLDTLADDIVAVLDQLDLRDVVLVGHSMGGAEVAHVVGSGRTDRVSQLVLSAPTTPRLTAGPDHPAGIPAEMLRANRAAMAADIGGWILANSEGYWGVGPDQWPMATDWTQRRLFATSLPVLLATNQTMCDADLRAEIAGIDIPTLVVQGDADRSAPFDLTGRPTAALLRHGELVVVEGAGHGLHLSCAEAYDRALLAFIGAGSCRAPSVRS